MKLVIGFILGIAVATTGMALAEFYEPFQPPMNSFGYAQQDMAYQQAQQRQRMLQQNNPKHPCD